MIRSYYHNLWEREQLGPGWQELAGIKRVGFADGLGIENEEKNQGGLQVLGISKDKNSIAIS